MTNIIFAVTKEKENPMKVKKIKVIDCSMLVTTSYYDSTTNRPASDNKELYRAVYSSNFNNMEWRKNGAAIAADADITYKYGVPSVDYKFNGKVIETHAHRLPI